MVFETIKSGISKIFSKPTENEYVEVDIGGGEADKIRKIIVKPFVLKQFEDVNAILEALREGYTITIIDIKQLKSKDMIELKRAISKIKKTAEALEGSIAGFGENIIIATPQFATIHRTERREFKEQKKERF